MSEQIAGVEVEHIYGPEQVPYGDDELVILCLVRDGAPWVRSFVEHYLSLGAKHLVFLDNGSSDETVSTASNYEHVTVLRTRFDFNAELEGIRGDTLMRRYLIERFGKDRWSLCVDIDELFDYPYSDVIRLDSLLGYLNSKSYTAVTAHMLDMGPERPFSQRTQEFVEPLSAEALRERYRFYDISKLERVSVREDRLARRNTIVESSDVAVRLRGGIRDEVFGIKPGLTKNPLLFSDGALELVSVPNVRNARVADFTCVLFHYKFHAFELQDYGHKAIGYMKDRTPRQREQFEKYAEVLKKASELRLSPETAREISSVNELLDNGFLIASEDYASWVDAEEQRTLSRGGPVGESRASAETALGSRRQEKAKTLKIERLEQQLLEHGRQEEVRIRRTRTLKRKLGALTQETENLERQLLAREQRITELKGELRDRGRRLKRLHERAQRVTQQNNRLKRRLKEIEASKGWKLISMMRAAKSKYVRGYSKSNRTLQQDDSGH